MIEIVPSKHEAANFNDSVERAEVLMETMVMSSPEEIQVLCTEVEDPLHGGGKSTLRGRLMAVLGSCSEEEKKGMKIAVPLLHAPEKKDDNFVALWHERRKALLIILSRIAPLCQIPTDDEPQEKPHPLPDSLDPQPDEEKQPSVAEAV